MRLDFHKLQIVCFFVLFFSFESVRAGMISGNVRNSQTSKPIAGVEIKIEGISSSVYTDSSGNFLIDSLQPGSWNLLLSQKNYEALKLNDIYVAGSENKRIDAEMNPSVYTLEKVVVRGNSFRRPPDMASSTKTMTFDEVLRSPGALVDVQRAVQELPSVSSASDNTNEIIVRGGNPGENLFIMDNIEIPNPNQFADQGSGGGVVSLINPLLMKGLTFNAGAPPASYGGKASSVLDVKLLTVMTRWFLAELTLGWLAWDFMLKAHCGRAPHSWHQDQKAILTCFRNTRLQRLFHNTGVCRRKYLKTFQIRKYMPIYFMETILLKS
jgi:hypothetical protein